MPPLDTESFPASLLERFAGDAAEALLRLLVFLSPITVCPRHRQFGVNLLV
jgi:hypothetical protein